MSVVNRRISRSGAGLHERCAQAISMLDSQEDPADIEDCVVKFIPTDEPLRSEAIETLAKVPHAACSGTFLHCLLVMVRTYF